MTTLDFIIRFFIVIFLAILIGTERQITGHTTGIKTTVLIAIGTFIFVSFDALTLNDDVRMPANIITGIGFLCSGVIFKKGLTVNGLNTAATLWCTAAVSVIVSYGFIIESVVATGLLVLFNLVLNNLSSKIKAIPAFDSHDSVSVISVFCLKQDLSKVKEIVLNYLDENTVSEIECNSVTSDKYRLKFSIVTDSNFKYNELMELLLAENVMSVKYEKNEE